MDKFSLVYIASPNFSTTTAKKLFKFAKGQNVQDRKSFVVGLIQAFTSFIGERYNENLRNGAGDANSQIWKIRCCAEEIVNILVNETDIRLDLDRSVQRHLGEMLSDNRLSPVDITTYRDPHFKQLLRYLEIIVKATEGRSERLKPGRPPASREAHHLFKRLYHICEEHGITPVKDSRSGKENSVLHKIRNIIRYDLDIGITEYDRIINDVIKECQESKRR